MILIYGIPNCNSVKNPRAWLEVRDIGYQFHDFKKSGIDSATLRKPYQWTRSSIKKHDLGRIE